MNEILTVEDYIEESKEWGTDIDAFIVKEERLKNHLKMS